MKNVSAVVFAALAPLIGGLIAGLLVPGAAIAAPLTVTVTDSVGKPVRNAVVVAELPGKRAPAIAQGYTMLQKNIAFQPFVLVVPVGGTVVFPNADNTRHQVYSFSATKRFELKLFARDQTRSVLFERAGVVALGCNIHDQMSAFLFITDNAWTARTDERGVAVLPDLPDGSGKIAVWHPYQRAPDNRIFLPLVAGQRTAAASLRLREPPMLGAGGY